MCKAWDDHKKRGIQEGMQQGRLFEIYLSVQEGDYSAKRGAENKYISHKPVYPWYNKPQKDRLFRV